MTDDILQYDFAAMEQASAVLARASKAIDAALIALETELDTLVAGWSGSTAEAYATAQKRWAARSAALNAVLAEVATTTATIADTHRTADRDAGDLWL